jgi:hypothetical protein
MAVMVGKRGGLMGWRAERWKADQTEGQADEITNERVDG